MRAARLHEYGKPFEIEDVPEPEPGPGEVVVRIGAAGCLPLRPAHHLRLRGRRHPVGPAVHARPRERRLGRGARRRRDRARGRRARSPSTAAGAAGCAASASGDGELLRTADRRGGGLGPRRRLRRAMLVPDARATSSARRPRPGRRGAAHRRRAHALPRGQALACPCSSPGPAVVIGAGGLGHMAIQFLKALSPASTVIAVLHQSARRRCSWPPTPSSIRPRRTRPRRWGTRRTRAPRPSSTSSAPTRAVAFAAADRSGYKGHLVVVGLAGGTAPYGFFTWPPESVLTGQQLGHAHRAGGGRRARPPGPAHPPGRARAARRHQRRPRPARGRSGGRSRGARPVDVSSLVSPDAAARR